MKTLMPAVVRQYGERGYCAPIPMVSRKAVPGVYAHIPMHDKGRIDGHRARERGR